MADDPPLPSGARYVDDLPPLPPGAKLIAAPSVEPMKAPAQPTFGLGEFGGVPPDVQAHANLEAMKGLGAGAAKNITGLGELLPGAAGRASARGTKYLNETGDPVAREAGYLGAQLAPVAKGAQLAGRGIETVLGGRSLMTDIAGGLGVGATTGAAAPTGKEDYGERLSEKGWDALAGAVLGGAVPPAARGLQWLFSPIHPPSAEHQALVDVLRNEGVDLTAGQETGSKRLRWFEHAISDTPGAGHSVTEANERQLSQFTRALLRRTGTDADRATPDVIDGAFQRIGGVFDRIGGSTTLNLDQQFGHDLINAVQDYIHDVPQSARRPIVENTVREIAQLMQNQHTLPGDTYIALRSRLGKLARGAARSDPQYASVLYDLQGALDGALERSAAPAQALELRMARNQYRNLIPVANAAAGAGEDAAHGLVSPSAIRNQVKAQQGAAGYARGRGDLNEVARAGEGVMKPLPSSGTAQRHWAQHVMERLGAGGVGGVMGAAGGKAAGYDETNSAALGALAGVAGPAIIGRLMMSPAGQAYLRNRLASGDIGREELSALENLVSGMRNDGEPTQPKGK